MQPTVDKSSMEAEYMALCFGTCEILGLNMTVTKLGYAKQKPISVYEDNQSAIYFSRNNTDNAKTKHIDVIYHFVREQLIEDPYEEQYSGHLNEAAVCRSSLETYV